MSFIAAVIAQTTQTAPQQGQPAAPQFSFFLPALLFAMLIFIFLSSRSQKKREKREREDMFGRMARNDRVLTIGGIMGTVISVKDNEVVLKVDESTNTKMTFLKTSIQRILSDDQPAQADKQ
ncbi:MAG: preprotein translocase subunit YajC [Phycisphaerales bacterium]|nr:MAG: preprotein translocase subunit YajC [Phycisphaerales bacterium]